MGTVGQGGVGRGQGDHGALTVGNGGAEQCRLTCRVPETTGTSGRRITEAECVPLTPSASADSPAPPNDEVRT